MKFSKIVLLAIITAIFISSCSFNKTVESNGESFLQGKWNEDSVQNKNQLVNYQEHQFTFTRDSFYLIIHSFSKVNLQGGTCYDANEWKEYAKGNYTFYKDTLKFNGNFVNKDFKYKAETSCYRTGKYLEEFLLKKNEKDSTIILKSLASGLYHQLQLK